MCLVRFVCLLAALVSLSRSCTRVMMANYGWKEVKPIHAVHLNFEKHNLELKTNSGIGSNHKIRMVFQNHERKESGGVFIKLSNPPQYMLGWCSQWKLFSEKLPADQNKLWKISKDKETVVVTCNEVEVINFSPSDITCDRWSHWRYYWERVTDKVKFTKRLDKASDSYRIQLPTSNWALIPRKRKFNLNLQREPLDISTKSALGSNDQISLLFYDKDGNIAGGLKMKLSTKPKFALPYCRSWTNFHWTDAKKLRNMELEKVWKVERVTTGVRILANGEQVLNFTVSDTSCTGRREKTWETYWGRQIDKVLFVDKEDKASKSCRVEEPIPTEAPKQKRYTLTKAKGHNWYGTMGPQTEAPTKHTSKRDDCWNKGVVPSYQTIKLLRTEWKDEEDCERLCTETAGCHAAFKNQYSRRSEAHCELFGVYDLYRPRGLYYDGRGWEMLAERKCFDPDHYQSHNETSPCGSFSWECSDRCIEVSWRCDGERDCEGGEDEEDCDSYFGPFCGPGLWKCPDFHLCPTVIDLYEDARCNRCISEEYMCNGYNNCYFGEDEREENCPAGIKLQQ